jgi:nuclease YhcG-like protein
VEHEVSDAKGPLGDQRNGPRSGPVGPRSFGISSRSGCSLLNSLNVSASRHAIETSVSIAFRPVTFERFQRRRLSRIAKLIPESMPLTCKAKLRRLVAVDLKLEKFRPEHAGQMEFYLRWLAKHEQQPHEEPPLGLILCSAKSQERIELMELGKSSIRVFVKNCTLNKRRNLPRKRNRSKPQRIPVMCCPNLLRKLGCGSAALSPLCDAILKLDEETFDPYRDCFVRPGLMRAPPCEPIIQRR